MEGEALSYDHNTCRVWGGCISGVISVQITAELQVGSYGQAKFRPPLRLNYVTQTLCVIISIILHVTYPFTG